MIDLHCHLLPGIDDGPEDVAGALALARAQAAAGIRVVACTPHVAHGYPANSSSLIAGAFAALREQLADEQIELEIVPGAEVALIRALELGDDELAALHLGGSSGSWLLLEAPLASEVPRLSQLVQGLQARGHRPLLAHPERCAAFHRDPKLLAELVDAGAAAQVTASSLTGDFGRTVQKLARGMVDAGLIHVVASDAHDARRRPPGLAEPLAEAGLGHLTEWATDAVPTAILAGLPLPPAPAAPRRRGLLRRR